jgi:putative polymerase
MSVLAIEARSSAPSAVTTELREKAMVAIILATLLFNFVLCFVNTNVLRVPAAGVIGSEATLIGLSVLLLVDRARDMLLLVGVYAAYGLFLCAVQGVFDPKPIRDILIPIVFYFAGSRLGTLRWGDRIVTMAVWIVLFFGLFEYFFLPLFIKYFDVLGYYVSRGTVQSIAAEGSTDRLFVSGMRYEGRTLLPFLGEHRVSSIFLEPVSVGNFGGICFSWIVLRHWGAPLRILLHLLPVITIFVFADARFGLMVSLASIPIFAISSRLRWEPVLLAPFAVMIGLAIIGFTYPDVPWDNTFRGRQLLSGQMLSNLPLQEVLAFVHTDRFTSDSGYTYTLTQIGLIGFSFVWGLFVLAPAKGLAAWRYKVFTAAYITLLLTISNSIYSIKTAALLWYLIGLLGNGEAEDAAAQKSPA